MQSTFKNARKQFIIWLFTNSQNAYVKIFKRNKIPWNVTKEMLLNYPNTSLGYHYAQFLVHNNFKLFHKLERHDAYHVMTGYQSKVEDEIALQYLCFGNGKRSIYLFGVIILGTLLLPDYWTYYIKSYRIGIKAHPFYHWNFEKLLNRNLTELQHIIFSKVEYLNTFKTKKHGKF